MATAPILEQCWEQCFRTYATEQNRGILQEVYKTGNTIKRMKDIYSANGITYLLDSTLATECWDKSSSSSSSSSSGSFENQIPAGNTAAGIWQLQLNMMGIISAMLGSTVSFPVQFNENAAWSCQEFSCLDCCGTMKLANAGSNYLSPVETNSSACMDGLLEPACRLAYHGLYNFTSTAVCGSATTLVNNMTVAILNSNAHVNMHRRGNYADYSPCQTFFDLRYSLGMNHVALDDMKRFESDDDFHNYMPDDPRTQAVVQDLFTCMYSQCCGSADAAQPNTAKNCWIATGHTGELISALTPAQFLTE